MIFFAMVREDASLDEARDAMIATIDGLDANPITAEEVERMRNQALSGFEQHDEQLAIGRDPAQQLGGDRRLATDVPRPRSRSHRNAPRTRSAPRSSTSSPRTAPSASSCPASPTAARSRRAPDVTAMLQGYKGDEARAEGEAFDPTPANIDSRTTRVELPGGIKLVMLPKETRGDAVNALIRLNYGDENSLAGAGARRGVHDADADARHAEQIAPRNPGRARAPAEPAQRRRRRAARVGATIQSTRANLAAVLALAIEVLREPAFPESRARRR